jgi:mRNA interferase MazF
MRRGEVHWADLVPRSRSGQTGRRPVIVVSHDGFNQTAGWRSIIVVPISTAKSRGRGGPTVIEISAGAGGLAKTSFAICHQATTLDRAKLTRRVGTLPAEVLHQVQMGLKAALDLD